MLLEKIFVRGNEQEGLLIIPVIVGIEYDDLNDESQLFRSFKSLHLFIKLMYMMYLLFCGSLIQILDKY